MNDEHLIELLRQTDSTVQPPAGPADLADRVRRSFRRRRLAVRATGAIAAALAVGLGIATYISLARPAPRPVEPADILHQLQVAQAELEELRAEVDSTVALLKAVRARQEYQARLATLTDAAEEPQEQAQDAADKAAFIIVYQADRKYRELGLKQSAISDYRQTIKLFPETHWAQVARQRLAQIPTSQGVRS